MSGPVAVLAVLERLRLCAIRGCGCNEVHAAEILETRAAVAELIGAATELADDQVHTDLDEPDYEPETTEAAMARNRGQRAYWRVRAALANVGSAS